MDALANAVSVEIPRSLLEEHATGEYQSKLVDLQMKGVLPPEQLAKLATPEMLGKFITAQRGMLEDQIRAALAMDAICEAEGISVTEAEIDAEVRQAQSDFEDAESDYDPVKLREQATLFLRNGKALELLRDAVSIDTSFA